MTDTGDKGDTGDPAEPGELHGGEMGDLGGLLEQAQQALSAHAQAAEQLVTGTAGGGVVTVEMTGAGEVRSVTLAPEVVDPADIDMLQDLIVAALHDAAHQVTELQRKALGPLGGLGDMLGGMTGRPAPGEG